MYCSNCGKHNQKGSKFCQHCGIKLSYISSKSSTQSHVETDTLPLHTLTIERKSTKIVNWIVSILVTLILALIVWIATLYSQGLNHYVSIMQSYFEPSKSFSNTGWIQFYDPHGRYSAYLPAVPEVEKYTFVHQGVSMTGHLYAININDNESIEITYMEDPNITFDLDSNATLDRALNGFLTNINGIVVSGENTTFMNYPAVDFIARANINNETIYAKGIIFLKDQELYSITEYDTTQKFSKFEKIRNNFELN